MKFALCWNIAQFRCNRACKARQTALAVAFGLRGLLQVAGTAVDIVAIVIESIDRATVQARFGITAEAGKLGQGRFRSHFEVLAQ